MDLLADIARHLILDLSLLFLLWILLLRSKRRLRRWPLLTQYRYAHRGYHACAEGIPENSLAAFRRDNLGFVFQEFNLLDTFSIQDNIYLPLVLAGVPYEEMERRLKPIADTLDLSHILKKFPYEVSGGQKQRAAVARALITEPQIILADEPTGALDSKASDTLLRLFGQVNQAGQTVLMVTHSIKAASHAKRVLFLQDGEVYHQLYRGDQTSEQLYAKISDTLTVLTQGGELHA